MTFERLEFYNLQHLGIVMHVKADASQEGMVAESNGKSYHSTASKTTPGAGGFFCEVVKTRGRGKRNVFSFLILSFIFNVHISLAPAVVRKTRLNVFQILALVGSLQKRDPNPCDVRKGGHDYFSRRFLG